MSLSFVPIIVPRGFSYSLRFEVASVFVVGVILPVLGMAISEGNMLTDLEGLCIWVRQPAIANSLVGVTVCACSSLIVLRRLRFFPGIAVAKSILPVFTISFGVLIAVIASSRVEYSNKLILSCFCAVLVARFAITAIRSRTKGIIYYLVPGGHVELVRELRSAPVFLLQSPSLAGLPDCAIVVDLQANLEPEWERFIAEAAISGRPVYHYKQVWEAETGRVQIEHLSENGLGALVPSFSYQKIKRGIDFLFSVVAIPMLLPIIFLCAIAIKWDSQGSVFYRQRRIGFRGKEFFVLKLRTMKDHEMVDGWDGSITQESDGRITRVGAFLRRTRLDETPQIINILRGEMSWIGPRPEAISLSQWYEAKLPFYRYRHIVRPGISGWAQVNQGHVAAMDEVNEKLQYDFYYIKNLSYWLDIVVALRTVKVILTGFGAR